MNLKTWFSKNTRKTLHLPRRRKPTTRKVGLPPGTLVYTGEQRTAPVEITVIDYDDSHFEEKTVQMVEECFAFKDTPTVTWININGMHQADVIEKIGTHFGIHPLVLEDLMSTGQRPKIEDQEDYIFTVLRMLRFDVESKQIIDEQVSLILGTNFVISFQEHPDGDVFDPIRSRIRTGKGRLRKMGVDYLAYSLIDIIVDNYFIVLEKLDETVEGIEEEMVTEPTPTTLQEINHLRREMIFLRRSIWPLREVISRLEKGDSPLFKEETRIYLRDVHEHTIGVIEMLEIFREMASNMLDTYLSSMSYKMNEVMKVLTIMATLFIPLTFIVGIYGMNFKFMPELEWRWGYPVVMLVMVGIGGGLLGFFRRKSWL